MRRPDTKPGFTLPAVLVVVAALLILAVGILLVTGVERDTARSFVDRQRAELAARAGLEEFRGILAKETANDDYLVIQSTITKSTPTGTTDTQSAPNLFLARAVPGVAPDPDEKKFTYRYIPLFSALSRPPETSLIAPLIDEKLTGVNVSRESPQYLDYSTLPDNNKVRAAWLPYNAEVRAAWLPVQDENGRIVARYAYWVEDLQSRVDPAIAGNNKGKDENDKPNDTHVRVAWPFPAPGLNDQVDSATEPALDQIATFALDPKATDGTAADQKPLRKTLLENRKLLVSPDSLLAAAAPALPQPLVLPLERTPTGDLVDPITNAVEIANAVEKGLVAGLRSYQEQPLVPFAAGIDPSVAGEPKLNLNKLLSTGGDAAVTEMADFINEALPEFDERKGGFPEDYVKTLAANAIDYADDDKTDENKNPTVKDGEYRGIDAYPLVSEFMFKPRIESVSVAGGRKYVDLSATVYVELWNMTNVPVKGDAEITYETKYGFQIPPNPNLFLLSDLSKAVHNLTPHDGFNWFPKFTVDLKPNEYQVIKCGMVSYSFDYEDASNDVGTTLLLTGEISGPSGAGYRMRWNGKLVDQSRGGLQRDETRIFYPSSTGTETKSRPKQKVRCNIPGHAYYLTGTGAINNMGDARMSFYILATQDNNAYPQNYSPNRRNIRLALYDFPDPPDPLYHNRITRRVLPSEWPDGGHDSPFGTDTLYGLLDMPAPDFNDEQRINPDDPRFSRQLPDLAFGEKEAPTRLSNSGRFYSVTELGRVYDPIMWRVRSDSSIANSPGSSWGDVSNSTSSANHGGGNTLRIGRPEHPAFDDPNVPGLRASHLLDLFHTGISRSADATLREGPLVKINGHVNLNTASKPALRQLIAGSLGQDPEIRRFKDNSHTGDISKFPQMEKLSASEVPDVTAVADRVADAIIRSRPFASTGELANTRESNGTRVFGNPELFPGFTGSGYPKLQWTDSAAEETFARAHDASTVRSRNFRIWVVGQSLAPSASVSAAPKVLAEIRKNFTVFADPGERKTDNTPDPAKFRLKILHESDF